MCDLAWTIWVNQPLDGACVYVCVNPSSTGNAADNIRQSFAATPTVLHIIQCRGHAAIMQTHANEAMHDGGSRAEVRQGLGLVGPKLVFEVLRRLVEPKVPDGSFETS